MRSRPVKGRTILRTLTKPVRRLSEWLNCRGASGLASTTVHDNVGALSEAGQLQMTRAEAKRCGCRGGHLVLRRLFHRRNDLLACVYADQCHERAFEIAAECGSVVEVERRLIREGYVHVKAHLAGRQIRAELASRLDRAIKHNVPKAIRPDALSEKGRPSLRS